MNDFLNNIKVAWISVITMLGTSLGSLLSILPDNIGKLGVLLTCIVSCILIRIQLANLKKVNMEVKMKELELQKMEKMDDAA